MRSEVNTLIARQKSEQTPPLSGIPKLTGSTLIIVSRLATVSEYKGLPYVKKYKGVVDVIGCFTLARMTPDKLNSIRDYDNIIFIDPARYLTETKSKTYKNTATVIALGFTNVIAILDGTPITRVGGLYNALNCIFPHTLGSSKEYNQSEDNVWGWSFGVFGVVDKRLVPANSIANLKNMMSRINKSQINEK